MNEFIAWFVEVCMKVTESGEVNEWVIECVWMNWQNGLKYEGERDKSLNWW